MHSNISIWLIYKFVILFVGLLSIFMGYKLLMKEGGDGGSDITTGRDKSRKLNIKRASPGVFYALAGFGIIAINFVADSYSPQVKGSIPHDTKDMPVVSVQNDKLVPVVSSESNKNVPIASKSNEVIPVDVEKNNVVIPLINNKIEQGIPVVSNNKEHLQSVKPKKVEVVPVHKKINTSNAVYNKTTASHNVYNKINTNEKTNAPVGNDEDYIFFMKPKDETSQSGH